MSHLYFTRSDLKLGLDQGCLTVADLANGSKRSVPLEKVDDISVFGQPQISTQLIRACISRDIPVAYYSEDGHYFGHISSSTRIDPERQKRQIYLTDDAAFCLAWSKRIVTAKIANSITLLQSMPEVHRFSEKELHGLVHSLKNVQSAEGVEEALGFEGNAARCYFSCLPELVRDEGFAFKGRSSRPPKDPFNSMLSFGYTLVFRDILGAVARHGLHPYFAFMHKLRFGHEALVSDLIEEYRAPLVDMTVLQLVNGGEVNVASFYENEAGAVYMDLGTQKALTREIATALTKGERYFSSVGDEKAYSFQSMLDKKLDLLVRAIEEKDPSLYVPFVWRPTWQNMTLS